ncbi:MAG: YncE family protein, partial [Nitrososphaerota archaeon]|nr:YncE family protein [Nitrososphaerota archaeon]
MQRIEFLHRSKVFLALLVSLALLFSLAYPNLPVKNSSADSMITTIPLGYGPNEVAVNPITNLVYATDPLAHQLWIVNGITDTVVGSVSVSASPMDVAVNPNTNMIYMTNYNHGVDLNTVWVINGATNSVVAKIPVGTGPTGVAVDEATNMIYVAEGGFWSNPNTTIGSDKLTVIDGATNSIVTNTPVGIFPFGVAVNPLTNMIYISNQNDNSVSVVDGSTNTVVATIGVGNRPADITVNQYTNMVYVSNSFSNTVSTIDGYTNAVVSTLSLASEPIGIVANPVTNKIYVSTGDIIDGTTNTVVQSLGISSIEGVAVDSTTNMIYIANAATLVVINGGAPVTSTLTVQTIDTNGDQIPGYYTVLFESGQPVTTGFSPMTFVLNNGESYAVQVQNYGNYVFDYWSDNGSTNQTRTISIASDTTLTAVYRNVNSPPPSTNSLIKVSTELANGTEVDGLYTATFQNGIQLQYGFSTYSFIVNNGQTYQVAVADYGNYHFSHWS